ncbi:MAG: amidohydrolase [Anaerolineaceae bacterium]
MTMQLLYNGKIFIPGAQSAPTALIIHNDTILAIGSDDTLLQSMPAATSRVNLEGKTVWPGLTDSHLHLRMYGEFLTQVDCETPTLEECLARVAKKASNTPSGGWILGHGWNQNVWQHGFGTATDLDQVSAVHPIYLTDKAAHSGWANSQAMKIAGVDGSTSDPEGGRIQRDDQGNPTGIFFENAVRLLENVVPPPSPTELQNSLLAAQDSILHYGVTAVHDFDGSECFGALQSLHADHKLKLRVCKGIRLEDLDAAVRLKLHTGFGDDQLWMGAVKCFADGALGPQTAAMLQPYEGSDSEVGTLLLTADQVFEIGLTAVQNNLSLTIHAIGDAATHEVLNGYGMLREFERRNHLPALPHRIEHLQLMHPDDVLKPQQLGIVASMQPLHATSDMFTADKYWGSRSKYAYLFKSMFDSDTRVIFGSDAPVESPNPFLGLHAAVSRRRVDGSPSTGGWYPAEKLSLSRAIEGYTTNPAVVTGKSGKLGTIAPGAKADLIVLDQDPFALPPEELHTLRPIAVIAGGEWIFGPD